MPTIAIPNVMDQAANERRGFEWNSSAWGVAVIALALMAIGIVAVATASALLDRGVLWESWWKSPLGRQAIFVVIGLVVMAAAARCTVWGLQREWCRNWIPPILLAVALVIVGLTMIPGLTSAHRGSRRWISFSLGGGTFSFQPSELVKIGLVAFLAWLLGRRRSQPRSFLRGIAPAAGITIVSASFVGAADFGTAALLAVVGAAIAFSAGCKIWHGIPFLLVGAAGMYGLIHDKEYRLERIRAHRDIWADPQGKNYQPVQSLASIASGGWAGVGLGMGVQKHGYLPEGHNDFIYAAICEETGVLGGALVLAMYAALMLLAARIVRDCSDPMERLLVFGIAATVGFQAAMNVAVVTVLAPTKGISLPLISAGGSGTLVFCAALGVMAGIAMRSEEFIDQTSIRES